MNRSNTKLIIELFLMMGTIHYFSHMAANILYHHMCFSGVLDSLSEKRHGDFIEMKDTGPWGPQTLCKRWFIKPINIHEN